MEKMRAGSVAELFGSLTCERDRLSTFWFTSGRTTAKRRRKRGRSWGLIMAWGEPRRGG